MKSTATLGILFAWLMAGQTSAQQGLKGEYYTGTNFERKVFTRIDPQLNFNWRDRSPAPGLAESYYSIRWTGKLLAPATGRYIFNAKVDDGIRVWVGNKKVMDSWQLNDSEHFRGSVLLEAGKFYDLRVDYFNDMLEGEIQLFWQLPNAPAPVFNGINHPGEPITAKYFFQKPDPNRLTLIKTPLKTVAAPPVAVVSTPPKVAPKKQWIIIEPKLVPAPLPAKKRVIPDTVTATIVPVRQPATDLKPSKTVILHSVQFEQSSYILLPESSAELDQVVTTLKKNPLWHIDIAGHTDNVGDPRLNLALSENRAKVVASYLTRRGISDDRIATSGYGSRRPVADNAIEHERSKNRRVEITIR
ncbi:OmpA family protein [Spirosoma luteum]|uniref:OmpA family protein n=1 Tax=Spirosoma luteum TaxID=431553 RepID=UPI0004766091|nr:PA14 domain-containing protein [Spirosoma luteum]